MNVGTDGDRFQLPPGAALFDAGGTRKLAALGLIFESYGCGVQAGKHRWWSNGLITAKDNALWTGFRSRHIYESVDCPPRHPPIEKVT